MDELLYKYRSLENFENFVDILIRKKLYAGMYQNMNDPMEGQYLYGPNGIEKETIINLTTEKEKLRICSLSKASDIGLMWAHYANGHRGVAIGVKVKSRRNYVVRPIEYNAPFFLQPEHLVNDPAIEILSHKMPMWAYEQEVRVFNRRTNFIDVEIKQIVTGSAITANHRDLIERLVKLIDSNIEIISGRDIMNY